MKTILISTLAPLFLLSCQSGNDLEPPRQPGKTMSLEELRKPENALSGLEIRDDLEAQLFTTEPLVRNPSNIDIDHRGRVWVVENVNYRPENNPDNPYQEGGDMVVILEDEDGNGRADTRTVFFQDTLVDGAMGIAVLGNKIYLSSSPNILVLTDTNRDDKADHIDTLFTGMGRAQNDHAVHAVSFGPDGRLYFNYGNASPGMLYKDGSPVIDKMGNEVNNSGDPYRQGMVFRCEMDGNNLESLGYNFRNNYEVCVDSYGRMWQSDNDDDGYKAVRINYVIEYGNFGYRDEITGNSWRTKRSGWHDDIPFRHWHQNDPGVVPNLLITGSGSPCGIIAYEGNLLPSIFHGQLLHADAGPGIVRAYLLKDDGAGFETSIEPIASRKYDPWYRPTDVSVAPDGSVFFSDWYDPGVGGHWSGDTKSGRIFRITTPKSKKYHIDKIETVSLSGAIEALKSPNAATRYLGWTALDNAGSDGEEKLLTLWNSEDEVMQARALWLLSRIDQEHLEAGLQHSNPLIRTTAIRVARQLYPGQLADMVIPLLNDSSAKVRREIAIALREMQAHLVPSKWAQLASQHDGEDRWYLEALGIGAAGRWESCFEVWLSQVGEEWNTAPGRDIIWRARCDASFQKLLTLLQDTSLPIAELARFLRATDFHEINNKDEQLAQLLTVDRPGKIVFQELLLSHITPGYAKQSAVVRRALQTILPQIRGTENYLDIVSKLDLSSEAPHLFHMVISNPGNEMGVSAAHLLVELDGWDRFDQGLKSSYKSELIEVLGHINQRTGKELLKKMAINPSEELSLRKKAVESLSLDWGWEDRMADLLAVANLDAELIALAATRLLSANRPKDRALGLSYLDHLPDSMRVTGIPQITDLIERQGIVGAGKTAFTTFCSTCHQIDNVGIEFGPDLSEIGNKLGKDALYSAIVYPSAQINHGYEGNHFQLKDGSQYVGYVIGETEEKVTLRVQSGIDHEISTSEIISRSLMKSSLMTEGLAQKMGEKSLVDLVAYLRTLVNKESYDPNPYQGKITYDRGE